MEATRPQQPWSTESDSVIDALSTDPEAGLDPDEIEARREEFGPNRLHAAERRGVLEILWAQVASIIVALLLAAGIVSLVMGEIADAVAIGVVLLLDTGIGFIAEWRARRSMEALRSMGEVEARVRRDGEDRVVDAEELVPGDIVRLDAGDVVPADLRLVDIDDLQIDESALTGESVPVVKQVAPVDTEVGTADRDSMAFRGTAVSRGQATAVVVATGMDTALGDISQLTAEAEAGQSPLDERLEHLGRRLTVATVAIALVVIGVGVLAGREVAMMVRTGVALAVAAIPEGLPIVATVALARGMWRMASHDAVVRRLPAVETLGSTTVICTDKTGTLTRNRMALERLVLADEEERDLTLTDGGDEDRLSMDDDELRRAVDVLVLANEVDEEGAVDDPMEEALLDAGATLGRGREDLVERQPRLRLVPFDRETAMVASIHDGDEGPWAAVKGATEAVLAASTRDATGASVDDEARRRWEDRTEALAADGLRVLALAWRPVDDPEDEVYEDLCFLGLIGLLDPPRDTVPDAVAACRAAGIRVVMVTGDHPETARAIADQVGLPAEEDGRVVRGTELDEVGPEGAEHASAVARVDPRQKLELVDALQEEGEVVAMTGDGVNDAPALRAADVGIAMGAEGTDVAREAADIILQDDAFETIVTAVRQGRILLGNIRKFVVYLLSGNVGEILLVGVAAVAGLPLPLLPLQILYLNVVNDVFPAFALGVGPGDPKVMEEPPRDPEEPLVTGGHWAAIVGYGVVIAASVFATYLAALQWLQLGETAAVTVSFLTLSVGRLLHAFNMRDHASGMLRNDVTTNPAVWGALALCASMLALAVYVPPLAEVLKLEPIAPRAWALVAAGSVVPLVLGQLYLLVAPDDREGPDDDAG